MNSNSIYKFFFKLLGPFIFLALIFYYGPQNILNTLYGSSLQWIFLGMLCMICIILIRGLRWIVLARCHDLNLPAKTLLGISTYSIALGNITPGNIGEFIKVKTLKQYGYGILNPLACSIADRMFDILYMILFAAIGLAILPYQAQYNIPSWTPIAGIFILFVSLTVVLLFKRAISEKLSNLITQLKKLKYTFLKFLSANLLTVVYVLMQIVLVKLGSLALDLEVTIPYIIAFYFPTLLVSVLPLTVAGLGTRDALYIYFLGLIGVSGEKAIALSTLILFFRLFSVLASYLLGTFILRRKEGAASGDTSQ
jgi:uncharacterized membrane protein YbhN (UPF0104 family)